MAKKKSEQQSEWKDIKEPLPAFRLTLEETLTYLRDEVRIAQKECLDAEHYDTRLRRVLLSFEEELDCEIADIQGSETIDD